MMKKISHLKQAIGNTPLAEIHFTYRGQALRLFAKLEYYNFTGSIKDRMALQMYEAAYARGSLRAGDHIAEATSGNAGIAITAIGRFLGHTVTIFMPDWLSAERQAIMRAYGADIQLISAAAGGFIGSIARTEQLQQEQEHVFLTRQFANADNVRAHETTTAPEIAAQLAKLDLTLHAFTAGVGTGGTVMGACQYFKARDARIRIHPAEPANSPTLRTGKKHGKHRIQGVSDDFIPQIVKLNQLDSILDVDDGDAILMAQQLARQLGLAVGISAGANFIAALQAQLLLLEAGEKNPVVATVFADDNKKYLSTDLMGDEPVRAGFYSPEVQLQDLIIHK